MCPKKHPNLFLVIYVVASVTAAAAAAVVVATAADTFALEVDFCKCTSAC